MLAPGSDGEDCRPNEDDDEYGAIPFRPLLARASEQYACTPLNRTQRELEPNGPNRHKQLRALHVMQGDSSRAIM